MRVCLCWLCVCEEGGGAVDVATGGGHGHRGISTYVPPHLVTVVAGMAVTRIMDMSDYESPRGVRTHRWRILNTDSRRGIVS